MAVLDAWEDATLCEVCGTESCEEHVPGEMPGASAPDSRTAQQDFVRRPNGTIIANHLGNVRLAFRRLGLALAFDEFRRETLINGRAVDDVRLDQLWIEIDDRFRFRPSKDLLRTLITTEACEHPTHPVREYLAGLTWDGIPRLDTWLTTYGGASPTPYVQAVGALPLVAAARRVRKPGSKFDELLVLESQQGRMKSSALRVLCPNEDWFSDDLPLGVDSKQVIERTTGKWIIEAAEMYGNRGREAEALKGFLSRQVDGPVRLAYARLAASIRRQFVLIGTTNARIAYLKDGTGARRFWPVHVEQFDVDALRRDRDQLWAEAAAREASGASTRLHRTLWAAAGEQQEQRRAADPWEDVLAPILSEPETTQIASSVVWDALGVQASCRDNRHADRVAGVLQQYGFTGKKKIRGADGKPAVHWVRTVRSAGE